MDRDGDVVWDGPGEVKELFVVVFNGEASAAEGGGATGATVVERAKEGAVILDTVAGGLEGSPDMVCPDVVLSVGAPPTVIEL